jgi:outer membrane protein OmpA-like peptidoglycan-associated protein
VKVRLLRAEEAFVDVAVLATGTAPTSTRGAYFGESSFTVAPELAVSRARDFVFFGANVGGRLRGPATITPSVIGQEVYYRAGLGVRLHELQVPITIGVTANGAISVAPYEDATPYVPHEAHLGVSYDLPAWLQLFAGVGTGITVAPGAPDVRAFLGVRFSPRDAPWGSSATPKAPAPAAAPTAAADRDVDGVDDEADRCPDGAEDRDGFEDDDGCPDPDDDKDAVLDADDACPRVAGPAGGERSGCPPIDHDGDSVPDSEDLCPTVEGTVALRGCLDGAGDSIADTFDACPTVAGPPGSDGCPPPACTPGAAGCGAPLAVLTSERVELKGRVYFEAGRSTIEARSFPLLDDAARVLVAHPEIAHVRVEGHTDETGSEGDNAALSQSRANAVRDYLVQRGVDAARLRAEGFGASRPLVEGKTTKARAENRRVELVIE